MTKPNQPQPQWEVEFDENYSYLREPTFDEPHFIAEAEAMSELLDEIKQEIRHLLQSQQSIHEAELERVREELNIADERWKRAERKLDALDLF